MSAQPKRSAALSVEVERNCLGAELALALLAASADRRAQAAPRIGLSIGEGRLSVCAAAEDVVFRSNLDASTTGEGELALDARTLVDIVRRLPSGPVRLSIGRGRRVVLQSAGATFRLVAKDSSISGAETPVFRPGRKRHPPCLGFVWYSRAVKLTVQLKLDPSPADADSLRRTLRAANAAADSISRRAFESGTFRQFDLHHLVYREVRERFGLSAQMTVRAISKVADAYKLDRDRRRTFRPHGAVAYDDRILCFKPGDSVSICTVDGRRTIGFVCGAHQRLLLPFRRGQADLVMRDGTFYLYCVVEVEEPALDDAVDVIGTDLGLANLATTSDGKFFAGDEVEAVRSRRTRERQSLQKRASAMKNARVRPKNVRRKLKSLAGRQARFQRDTNHCISKKLVANAKDTKRAIALEDLKGIRGRVRFGRDLRARLGNWAFAQLAFFVVYKAARAGVRTDFVDPRHTSQTCHECGHRERANRTSQAQFRCRRCGHTAHADVNAALNIRARAAVNRPKVAERHLVSPTA